MQGEFFKKNILFVISLIIFVCITLPAAINVSPFFDSAWAWYLSKIINFDNWLQILSNERHCILWYLILKPFAVKNLFYPYSLQLLNWIFCAASVIVLWKKFSVSNFIKVIITFSFIFMQYFALISRCYSIGILGLFLLIYLQKKSLKRPVPYAVIAGLTANTSAMAAIPVSALILIFIFDVIKNKSEIGLKSLISSFGIIIFSFLFLIPPLFGSKEWFDSPQTLGVAGISHEIISLFNIFPFEFFIFIFSYLSVCIYVLFLAKGNKAKFLLVFSSVSLLTLMLAAYNGTVTHKLFFIVYVILAVLLQNEEYKYERFKFFVYILLSFILFLPIDISPLKGMKVNRDLGFYMLQKDNIFENSYVVFEESDYKFELIPYILQNPKIILIDNNPDFKLDYKMRSFGELEPYLEFAKKNNKTLFLITHYPYRDYEPFMIFENKYTDDNGCERYIYKFD